MTESEALKTLEDLQRLLTNYRHISKELTEANGMAIKALEKQIPKKPIEIKGLIFSLTKDGSEAHEIICECPNCRSRKLKRGFPCKCGQKLDWE